jgi:hypothetical protein
MDWYFWSFDADAAFGPGVLPAGLAVFLRPIFLAVVMAVFPVET